MFTGGAPYLHNTISWFLWHSLVSVCLHLSKHEDDRKQNQKPDSGMWLLEATPPQSCGHPPIGCRVPDFRMGQLHPWLGNSARLRVPYEQVGRGEPIRLRLVAWADCAFGCPWMCCTLRRYSVDCWELLGQLRGRIVVLLTMQEILRLST
jgi:hypothetical protein